MRYVITMKLLWYDNEKTMSSCMNFVDALYKLHYEKTYEIMIWIDYELLCFKYEKVFFH